MSLPSSVHELLASQYGLVANVQLRSVLTPAELRSVYRSRELERVSARLLHHRAVPVSLGSVMGAGVLDALPDACLWSASAALWWGFGRTRDRVVHVGRRTRIRRPVARIHRIRELDAVDVTVHQGLPVARPERVLLSLAAIETRRLMPSRLPDRRHGEDLILLRPAIERVERVTDQAWSAGLVNGEFIHEMVTRLEQRGRAGVVVLREVLRRRPPDYLPAESGTELRFEEVIGPDVHDLGRQVRIDDERGFIGRVDYGATTWPLIIEINGEPGHTSLTDRRADLARYERLMAAGYSILVWWSYDVWQRPALVADVTARLLRHPDDVPTLHRPTPPPWDLLPRTADELVEGKLPLLAVHLGRG